MPDSQQVQFLDVLRDIIAVVAARTISSMEFSGSFSAGRYDPEQIQDLFFNDNPQLKYVTFGDERHDHVFVKIFKENAEKIRASVYTILWNTVLKDIGDGNYELRLPIDGTVYQSLAILFNINNDLKAYGRLGFDATTAQNNAKFLKPCVQFATEQIRLDKKYALPPFKEKTIRQTPPSKPRGFKKLFGRKPQQRQFRNLSEIGDELADTVRSGNYLTGTTAINIIDNLARLENGRKNGWIESRFRLLAPGQKHIVFEEFSRDYKELLGTVIILTHEDFIKALAGFAIPELSAEITEQIGNFQKKYPAHAFFLQQEIVPQMESSDREQLRADAQRTSSELYNQHFVNCEPTGLIDASGRPIMKKSKPNTFIHRQSIIPGKQK